MKKIFKTVLIFSFYFIFVGITVAQTPTSSPSATISPSPTSAVDEQIQNIKERVANKVAELRKEERKAYSGVISSISAGSIYFKSFDDKNFEAKLDDLLTKIYLISGSTKKEAKLSDLKKNDFIVVTGVASDKIITANFIYRDERYFVKAGKVTEVNKSDYYVKILTSDKNNLILDVETYTKIKLINIKTLEVEKSGFSKIKEGDSIHFVYKKSGEEKEQNRFSAQTILIIPQEYFIK